MITSTTAMPAKVRQRDHEGDQAGLQERGKRVDVRGHPGHDPAGQFALVVVQPEPLQVRGTPRAAAGTARSRRPARSPPAASVGPGSRPPPRPARPRTPTTAPSRCRWRRRCPRRSAAVPGSPPPPARPARPAATRAPGGRRTAAGSGEGEGARRIGSGIRWGPVRAGRQRGHPGQQVGGRRQGGQRTRHRTAATGRLRPRPGRNRWYHRRLPGRRPARRRRSGRRPTPPGLATGSAALVRPGSVRPGRRCRRSRRPAGPGRRAPRQQLVVGADVDHPAGGDHRDPVGQREGGPAVRDQDRGAVGGEAVQRLRGWPPRWPGRRRWWRRRAPAPAGR